MKRKIIIMLLFIAGVGQFLPAIQVRIPSLTGVVGDTLTVPLYVDDDLAGSNVLAYQFNITYYNSSIKFIGATTEGTISSGFNELRVSDHQGYFTIVGAGTTPLVGKGVLLNIKMVLTGYSTYLQFKDGVSGNFFNEGAPVLTLTYGYITINDKPVITITPANVILNIGDTQQFSSWGGFPPYSWSVSDNSIATIAGDGMLTVLKSGIVKVAAIDSKGYRGESGDIDCRSFRITLRDTSFYQNNFIDIPVAIYNLDAKPMVAGKFVFSFNQNVLAFDSLITSKSILAGIASVEYSKQTGKVTISFASSGGVISSGILLELRFKIADVGYGGSYINFDEAVINESILPKCRNGYFSINALSTLYISPPGNAEMYSGESKQFTVSGGTAPYTWEVEDPALATVSASGYLTTFAGGQTNILVKDVYGAKGSSQVVIYDTWLNVRDSSAVVDKSVLLLPVDLGPLPSGKEVISISGKAYSSFSKIDSIQVVTTESLTQSWQMANKTGKNESIFALSSAYPILNGGKLFYFKVYFNQSLAIGDAFYISCNDLMLNEGTPNLKVSQGYITIKKTMTDLVKTKIAPVSVYPLPVSDKLFIYLTDDFKTAVISVVDLSGKTILATSISNYNENRYVLAVGILEKGIYFLKLHSGEKSVLLKFIKN